ncbi:anthranilate synthase component I family protein [Paenibacillus alvei]|uniref:anthranilate synthase component I family protein n=1 Tax=Paenibacillus alvei TaxID=44250 RepID=UPI00227ED1EC|nr:anthranilate synthase component I family protein [Paenibacillus alvei]MCY7485474.1 anthranilate synthase component I family protein [Paenibacillus alvei]
MIESAVVNGQALIAREQWHRFIDNQYTILPYVTKYDLEPGSTHISSWESAWAGAGSYTFVLESGKGGRYTIVGINPASMIRGKGRTAQVIMSDGTELTHEGTPLEMLKEWMSPYRAPRITGLPDFTGGCVGYISYDIARSIERLPELAEDDLNLPDFVFMQMNELWIIDHKEQAMYCAVMTECDSSSISMSKRQAADGSTACGSLDENVEWASVHYALAEQRAYKMKEQWDTWWEAGNTEKTKEAVQRRQRWLKEDHNLEMDALQGVQTAFPKENFEKAVRQIQQYICQGDVFQVNLSMRQTRTLRETPERLYEWLRVLNPSPYMGLLRFPDFQLVSCSPELLVSMKQGEISTRPIAGTRRRGHNLEEDARMAEELRTNEKERAEHIMLVDLERNDVGRISEYGSVRVEELMAIEYYSHVMHLVSEVKGKLAAGKDAFDVLRATFPGGTITGAPKVRTMEIIEELEPVRRGPYTGSFGWIDYNGDMEFNIIIRTMTVKDGVGHIQAGAGIVIDSNPEREYKESWNKAKALWKAVQLSERDMMERGD